MNKWLKNIAHFIIGVLVAFIVAEFLLGNFQFRMPHLYYKNSLYGWVPKGGQTLVWGNEGFGKYTYNSYGFLDKKIPPKKNNVYRVIVIGDSHTEARQVPYGQRFTELAEKYTNERLAKKGSKKKVEIINLGVSGQSNADYIYYGKSYVQQFRPDMVVFEVAYQDFLSDATDGSKSIYLANDNGNYSIKRSEMYFAPQSGSRLFNIVHHYQGYSSILDDFINRLPYHLDSARKDIREAKEKAKALKHPNFNIVAPYSKTKEQNTAAIYPPGYEPSSREQNGKLIDFEIKELQKDYGKNIVFLELPYTPNLDEKGNVRVSEPVEDYWRAFLFTKFQDHHIDYIDPLKSYVDYWRKTQNLTRGFQNTVPGSGHLNTKGHEITADKLSDYMTKKVIGEDK